ncbi:unnamed protein product [Cyprideis torosa]|uniref:Uncharacterized protein n=1 Tax=Cyprideis torosa TaxID=163714 RepID=A0A7R8W989_9CRUS|nr:unnamed protein product [Cyprideis torosa]CAG0888285.1 unnamed protein product [Cyprideis torosa]
MYEDSCRKTKGWNSEATNSEEQSSWLMLVEQDQGRFNQIQIKLGLVSHLRISLSDYNFVQRNRTLGSSSSEKVSTLDSSAPMSCPFQYVLVLDFEATCWHKGDAEERPPEIIEFPCVLVDVKAGFVVEDAVFHAYVKPSEYPKLSKFCTDFTDWDLGECLRNECARKGLPFPVFSQKWVDLKALYRKFYRCRRAMGLEQAMAARALAFQGRPHCGLDDAKNLGRLFLVMVAEGCPVDFTSDFTRTRRRRRPARVT